MQYSLQGKVVVLAFFFLFYCLGGIQEPIFISSLFSVFLAANVSEKQQLSLLLNMVVSVSQQEA